MDTAYKTTLELDKVLNRAVQLCACQETKEMAGFQHESQIVEVRRDIGGIDRVEFFSHFPDFRLLRGKPDYSFGGYNLVSPYLSGR